MAAACDLPDALVSLVIAQLPWDDRVKVAPHVCRQWRRAAAVPSPAWAEIEFECSRLPQFHSLMRWLRTRMPAVRRLRLGLYARPQDRRRRFGSHCAAALRALAARLAAGAQLQSLALSWDVVSVAGCDNETPGQIRARQGPLHLAALLPLPSRTARRSNRPLALPLSSLELSCAAGVVLCPQLRHLLPTLCTLHIAPGSPDYTSVPSGPLLVSASIPRPAGQPAALWLPPTLTCLCLSAVGALTSLAALGPSLPAALPALRCLRLPLGQEIGVSDDDGVPARVEGSIARLLEGLLPLAGQLQSLELPPHCLAPPVVARFTALHTLLAPLQPADREVSAFRELWSDIFSTLGRLHTLDLSLRIGDDAYTDACRLPLRLEELPASLRQLRLLTSPALDITLPAGDHLAGLTCLCLTPQSALRITPLLPYMPQLSCLEVVSDSEVGTAVHVPVAGGSGDEAMDQAAAAAAALPMLTPRDHAAAAGALAVALARRPRFHTLRLLDGWFPSASLQLALRLQRLSPRVEVEMGDSWGGAAAGDEHSGQLIN